MEAFEQLVVQKKEQEKVEQDAAMDQLQAGIAALKVQQQQQQRDQERQRRKEEEKRLEALDYRALHSLRPRSDKRLRLVIDTNIFLEKLPSGCTRVRDVWDKFEREHAATAKVLIPQVVFEEIDRKRRHHDGDISSQARAMMRYLDTKFSSRACSSGDGFWELQDRDIDDEYKRKAAHAGTRSCDLRIFYLLRDCHRLRPGCLKLVLLSLFLTVHPKCQVLNPKLVLDTKKGVPASRAPSTRHGTTNDQPLACTSP